MRSPNGNSNIVASQCINIFGILMAGRTEAEFTLSHQECFVVHLVPVRWRSHGSRWDDEFGGT